MNLQQLRYLVATADEGTMTRAAEALHVAQPALSRAVRAVESEIGVTVFERTGRGVRITRQGREVVGIARRILSDLDRLAAVGASETLRVCAISGQAREIGSPAVARYVAQRRGRVALDVVDTPDEVVDNVRDGRAQLGIVDLPAPTDLTAISLGWQELVLVHPPAWTLPDPLPVTELSGLPLVAPASDDWRHEALERNLRAAGVDPAIAAETTERDVLIGLVQQGAGAWFSYGRQAQAAVAGGAGVVHLTPMPVREVGIVNLGQSADAAQVFIDMATEEAAPLLIPAGDPRLADATWISGDAMLGTSPPSTSVTGPRSS
jgi:LysR family transcriptional regulator, cyn operon transcriptional activator